MLFRFCCTILALILPFSVRVPSTEAHSNSVKVYLEFRNFHRGLFEGTQLDGSSLRLDPGSLKKGQDTTGRYNRGDYYYGRWTSPIAGNSFMEAIASWQANTPAGTWLEIELRAEVKGVWTKWYSMGVWHEHDEPFKRHSVNGQGDRDGTVSVDTLVMKKKATAIQARVTLFTVNPNQSPALRSIGIALSTGSDQAGLIPSTGITSSLDVPMRSQMVYPDGGEVWCSPTSTSMVMAYWARVTGRSEWDQTVPTVVNGVWDYVYDGGGNWPFNTAYAASLGLESKVVRMSSLAEVEQWTAAGVPVIASIAYKEGELPGSPIPSTNGHLLVIRGFDQEGNVLTNDPAGATNGEVRITYNRKDFEEAFLNHSNGTVYLIYPHGWNIPVRNGHW